MAIAVGEREKYIYVGLAASARSEGWNRRQIHQEALRRIGRLRGGRAPSQSWAYTFIGMLLDKLENTTWLEEPWTLGSLSDPRFSSELVPAGQLLKLARHARITELPFTNRQAQWATRLTDIASSRSETSELGQVQGLLMASQIVAEEELWAFLLEEEFDTRRDLDLLATYTWPHFTGHVAPTDTRTVVRYQAPGDRWDSMTSTVVGEVTESVGQGFGSSMRNQNVQAAELEADEGRGDRLYMGEVRSMFEALYRVPGVRSKAWHSDATLDRVEMVISTMKRIRDMTDAWDDLRDDELVDLAKTIVGKLESGRGINIGFVEEIMDEWRSTDG